MNQVFLVGRLGGDPELRTTATGLAVCNFSVATDAWDKRKEVRVADWHRIVAFDRQAENCNRYLRKGAMVAVSGKLAHHKWTTEDGEKRSRSEVKAFRVSFMSKKGEQGRPAAVPGSDLEAYGGRSVDVAGRRSSTQGRSRPAEEEVEDGPAAEELDAPLGRDDLPF